MKREQKRERIHRLCNEMRDNCDALGRFSDHEGGIAGPTWQAYKDGYLARRALEAIALHRKAISLWGQLYNLERYKAKSESQER